MKRILTLLLTAALLSTTTSAQVRTNGYPITQVPFTAVKVAPGSFWGERIRAAREVTIPLAFSKCESEHRYKNFEMAAYTLQHPGHAGLQTPEWDVSRLMGFSFDDTDVYKTIEGASYVLQTYPDERLKQYIDSVLDIVAAAQEPDGYLYTARTINPQHPHQWSGQQRWQTVEVLSHELYNLGHMVDAACAHYQATGSRKFLDIARRYADCVLREVGRGEGQARVVPGHQIAEMALARLYVLTGERKYLEQAKYFLDERGRTTIHDIYTQSDHPVTTQTEAWGHAVRAGYMYAGMADVAALTGDSSYIRAIDAIWQNIVSRKYYITGGVGARHQGEAFGADYELPNLTAYNETCAAIAQVYLNQRMFLLHGDSKYIDCLERTLYNGVISGMSADGGRFFYPNPLSSDGEYRFNADNTLTRQPWFGCACCPSNLCRFIPSLPGYLYAVRGRNVYVNLFAENTASLQVEGKSVSIEQQTNYPWDGDISIRIGKNQAGEFSLMVRLPGWAVGQPVPSDLYQYDDRMLLGRHNTLTVNGQAVDNRQWQTEQGYIKITRKWKKGDTVRLHLEMRPRIVLANEQVTDDRGRVAVERGPLVYCTENVAEPQFNPFRFVIDRRPKFGEGYDATLAGGVKTLTATGQYISQETDGHISVSPHTLTLIPYYAWNHRGACKMEVWMARDVDAVGGK